MFPTSPSPGKMRSKLDLYQSCRFYVSLNCGVFLYRYDGSQGNLVAYNSSPYNFISVFLNKVNALMLVPGDRIEETRRERHCIQEKFDLSHSQITKECFRYECSFLLVKIASLIRGDESKMGILEALRLASNSE